MIDLLDTNTHQLNDDQLKRIISLVKNKNKLRFYKNP